MRFKLKIFTSILIVFFPFKTLEIKAHNDNNGGCKDHCSTIINTKGNDNKIQIFKKNKKLIREINSCVNNSLCRG